MFVDQFGMPMGGMGGAPFGPALPFFAGAPVHVGGIGGMGGAPFGPAHPFGGGSLMPMGGGPATMHPLDAMLQRGPVGGFSQRGRRMSMPGAVPRPNHPLADRPWMAAGGDPVRNFDPSKFQRSPRGTSIPHPGHRSRHSQTPQRAPVGLQRAQSHRHRSDRVRFAPQAEEIRQPQHVTQASQQYDKVKSLKTGGMSESLAIIKGRSDGKLYVQKCIRADGRHRSRAQAELNALGLVRGHPNLNHMFEATATANGLCSIVLEFCDRGSLADRMEEAARDRVPFNEASTWNILLGVSRGLAFLHDGMKPGDTQPRHSWNAIAHLDVKPQNILISTKGGEHGERRIVLADFGCAVSVADLEAGRVNGRRQPAGTRSWYPPEGRAGTAYGVKTDMYMLGATIHCMCQLRTSPSMTISRYESPCGNQFSKELNRVVRKLTQDDGRERPAARKVADYAVDGLLGNLGRSRR